MTEGPNISEHDSCHYDSRDLARLVSAVESNQRIWRPEEFGVILRHQMESAVQFDLGGLAPGIARKAAQLAVADRLTIRSYGELFQHPRPPIPLLILVKQYAKAMLEHPESPLPVEVARVLYLASILVARIRHNHRISKLDDPALKRGIERVLDQSWLDPNTRTLFEDGLSYLAGSPEPQDAGESGD